MMEVLVIIIVLSFIGTLLWITWEAIETRENIKEEIDKVIEEVRKSKKL